MYLCISMSACGKSLMLRFFATSILEYKKCVYFIRALSLIVYDQAKFSKITTANKHRKNIICVITYTETHENNSFLFKFLNESLPCGFLHATLSK